MSNDAILGLIASIIGGSVVAFTNHLLERKKKAAEANKLNAEAEMIKAQTTKLLMELSINNISTVDRDLPDGWFVAGSYPDDYEVGIDRKISYRGNASACIKSLQIARGFGTLMQNFKADDYRGKRLRMSAYVKTESVKNWAGLWMRVDGPDNCGLSFDNMDTSGRPIKKTTDWTKYEIVLNVPENSTVIAFGVLLNGQGQIWVNEFQFEFVDENVPITQFTKELIRLRKELRKQPANLNF